MRTTDTFIRNLEAAGGAAYPVESGAFREMLTDLVEPPMVGISLTTPAVSLEGTDVSVDPTPAALKRATTGVTSASMAVADYGTAILPCTPEGAELVSLFVDKHVVVLSKSDIVADMETALTELGAGSDVTESRILATGPSATADMGSLVEGAHGPKDVAAIIVSGA